jgi:hypothetical protein
MPVIRHPPGTPLPNGHLFKGSRVIVEYFNRPSSAEIPKQQDTPQTM